MLTYNDNDTTSMWDEMMAALEGQELDPEENDFNDQGELKKVRLVETEDHEVERAVILRHSGLVPDEHGHPRWETRFELLWDDGVELNRYFTRSGDNPVVEDQYTIADRNAGAGGWLQLEPEYIPRFYPATKESGRQQQRVFHSWIRFIHLNQANPRKLRDGWKAFWRAYFERKAKRTLSQWLYAHHITMIRKYFARCNPALQR